MQSILVTGGAGFIGSHTVVELAAAGFRPVILDNFSNSKTEVVKRLENLTGQQITCYEAAYQNADRFKQILKKEKIEGVIHFAAYKAVGESVAEPLKYYGNNVSGFVSLLEALLDSGINNLVFSSSAAVYGEPPEMLVTEETVCNPASPYGWSKYMDEVILRDTCAANPALKGVSLRYFNVVGAHDSAQIGELPLGKPQNLLPIVVQAAAGITGEMQVYGDDYSTPDGSCQRDYVHVVDLAQAHVAALKKVLAADSGSYNVYNIGTGKPTSVFELIQTFEKVNGVKVPYKVGPKRAGDPAAYYASVDKIKGDLGWQSSKTLEDAVRDAWRWQQSLKS